MFQAFHRRFTPIECQWLQFTNYIHRQADLLKLAARMCLGTLGTWWRPQRQKNGCILGSESSWSHPNVSNGAERTLWTDLILAGSQNGRVWSHRKIFPNENHGFSTWSSWPVSSSHLACQGWKTASMWMSSCEVWEHSWASGVLLSQRYLFPTCQVRVVRFYQSCSSPSLSSPPPSPPPPLHPLPGPLPPLPCPLPPCQFFAKLFANFRAQCALLDLNCRLPIWVGTAGPQPLGSERSGHRWTSTSGAQWAPLDLNLGPSELSEHRWTSTWDPPSSVSTAGPQRPDRMPEDMPDRTPDRLSERMPEDMPDKLPECLPDRMPPYESKHASVPQNGLGPISLYFNGPQGLSTPREEGPCGWQGQDDTACFGMPTS